MRDLDARADLNALSLERRAHRSRGLRLLRRKDACGELDERHLHPKARKDLCELGTDRTGTDHRQPVGQLFELEDSLVVQVACLTQTGYGRHHGLETCRDQDRLRLDLLRSADQQLPLADEDGLARETHLDAGLLERVRAKPEHVVAHLKRAADRAAPLQLWRPDSDSIAAGAADEVEHLGRPHESFGRDAAMIRACAAEVIRLCQQDARLAAVRNGERGLRAGGAAADYDEVVRRPIGSRTFQLSW